MSITEAAERYLVLRGEDPHLSVSDAVQLAGRTPSALAGWRKNPEFRARELAIEEARARDALASTLRQEYELAQQEERQPRFIPIELTSRQELYLESMRLSYDNAAARQSSGLSYSQVQAMLSSDPAFRLGMQEIEAQEKEKLRDRIIREATTADLKTAMRLMEKLDEAWVPRMIQEHKGSITHVAQAAREEGERWRERPVLAAGGPSILTAQTPPKVYREDDEEPS